MRSFFVQHVPKQRQCTDIMSKGCALINKINKYLLVLETFRPSSEPSETNEKNCSAEIMWAPITTFERTCTHSLFQGKLIKFDRSNLHSLSENPPPNTLLCSTWGPNVQPHDGQLCPPGPNHFFQLIVDLWNRTITSPSQAVSQNRYEIASCLSPVPCHPGLLTRISWLAIALAFPNCHKHHLFLKAWYSRLCSPAYTMLAWTVHLDVNSIYISLNHFCGFGRSPPALTTSHLTTKQKLRKPCIYEFRLALSTK